MKFNESIQKPEGHLGDDPRPYWIPPKDIPNREEFYKELGILRHNAEKSSKQVIQTLDNQGITKFIRKIQKKKRIYNGREANTIEKAKQSAQLIKEELPKEVEIPEIDE